MNQCVPLQLKYEVLPMKLREQTLTGQIYVTSIMSLLVVLVQLVFL